MSNFFNIYFDGSCRPFNPGGVMGIGGYITDENGEWVFSFSEWFEARKENSTNKAEVIACYKALSFLYDKYKDNLHNIDIKIYGDSKLVCSKMNKKNQIFSGLYSKQAEDLYFLSKNSFRKVEFIWIPREENTMADELSKQSLCENNLFLCD